MPSQNSTGFASANPIKHFSENFSARFFGGLRLAKRGDDFKFFPAWPAGRFGGKFPQLCELRLNAQNLSFFRVSRFSCVDKVFHSFNLEKPASGVPLRGTKIKNSILRLKSAGEPSQRASQTLLFPIGGVYLKISLPAGRQANRFH